MNRQAYAWFANPSDGQRVPDPPLFSRHVEFLQEEAELKNVTRWWKDEDINRTVGNRWTKTVVTASDLKNADHKRAARWVANTSWFLDFSHGGTPNLWRNICHFSNSLFPFFEAAYKAQVCNLPLSNVLLWQVAYSSGILSNASYHGGLLGAVLDEHRRVWSDHHGVNSGDKVRIWFDDDINAGDTLCFEEAIVVRETNLQHRKITLQTKSSMSTGGVARGFGMDREVQLAFRRPC